MARIDWAFIGTLEGEAIPKGYVPSDNSGVTIATGVDLGQRAMPELLALGLAAALTDKLKPYLGLKGNAARDKLNSAPLTLSAAEVAQLDQALRARFLPALVSKFNAAGNTGFDDLKPAQQPAEETRFFRVAWAVGGRVARNDVSRLRPARRHGHVPAGAGIRRPR